MDLGFDIFISDENAQREIARKLDFDFNLGSEDWEYELSNIRTIEEYIQLYEHKSTSEKAKSSLLEMIIDSIEDYLYDFNISKEDKRFSLHLLFIKKSIIKNLDLHKGTLVYWIQRDSKISDHLIEIVEQLEIQDELRWRPF